MKKTAYQKAGSSQNSIVFICCNFAMDMRCVRIL
jgi:hypothetical protein